MENNNNNYPNPSDIITRNIASSTDFTGMIPSLLNDDSEMDAYAEIFDIPEQGNLNDLKEEIKKEIK